MYLRYRRKNCILVKGKNEKSLQLLVGDVFLCNQNMYRIEIDDLICTEKQFNTYDIHSLIIINEQIVPLLGFG